MSETIPKQSPLHADLASRGAVFRTVADMPLAVRLESHEAEQAAIAALGLCDLSALTSMGFKGPRAAQWLSEQQIDVPGGIYETRRLAAGGLAARIGGDEFLLQNGIGDEFIGPLAARLNTGSEGVYRVERQEATILLIGPRAVDVLAQTCGVNFREAVAERVIYSRVAGVSCGIIPETTAGIPAFRIWVDYTYASWLWETLDEIAASLGGRVIGAGCLFPELR